MAMYSDADIKSLRARAAMLQEPTKRIDQAGGMVVPYSMLEGFTDAFKKGYAGYLSGKADTQEKTKEDSMQNTLNEARVAMMGRPSEYDENTGITWNEQKPDPSQLAGILMSNPQTADMGLKLSLQKQQDEKDTALIRNYQAAKLGGYNGSFTDFMMQTKLSGAGADAASLVNGVTDPTAYAVAKGSDTVYNRPSKIVPPTQPPTQVQPDVSIGKSTGIPPMDQSQLVDPQFDAQRQQAAVQNQAALSQPAPPLPQTGSVAPLPGVIEAASKKAGSIRDAQNASDLINAAPIKEREVTGKALGDAKVTYSNMITYYPKLQETVDRLVNFADDATYTSLGRAKDQILKEMQMGGTTGAKARSAYESAARNTLYPLLRQTFGAQFTENEGERLIATLGDPNTPPQTKKAVLDEFMTAKRQAIEAGFGNINTLSDMTTGGEVPKPDFKQENRKTYNPVTKSFE